MIDPEQKREDWYRLITEIEATGLSVAEIGRCINCPDSTVRSWKNGTEPLHYYGNALIRLHQEKIAESAKLRDRPLDLWGKKRP